jgi:hypothetical protein
MWGEVVVRVFVIEGFGLQVAPLGCLGSGWKSDVGSGDWWGVQAASVLVCIAVGGAPAMHGMGGGAAVCGGSISNQRRAAAAVSVIMFAGCLVLLWACELGSAVGVSGVLVM